MSFALSIVFSATFMLFCLCMGVFREEKENGLMEGLQILVVRAWLPGGIEFIAAVIKQYQL